MNSTFDTVTVVNTAKTRRDETNFSISNAVITSVIVVLSAFVVRAIWIL